MASDKTFVKLYRKIEEWEWYQDYPVKCLFIHCLIKANWEDGTWQGIKYKRGQFITSLKHLTHETGLTFYQIRNSLDKLESTHEITKCSTSKYTIITVNNYDQYQTVSKQTNTQTARIPTTTPQTNRKQVRNRQEYKDKEVKNKEEIKKDSASPSPKDPSFPEPDPNDGWIQL
jgi:hypothetical protein